MAAVLYPSSLPCPATSTVTPAERRALSSADRPREARNIQRDRLEYERVTWPAMEIPTANTILAFWRDTLQRGGAWFVADWPLPRGTHVQAVRKFREQPKWQFIPGGFWQLSALCEVRGRGVVPQVDLLFAFVRLLMHFDGDAGAREVVDVKGHSGEWRSVNDDVSALTAAALRGRSSANFLAYGDGIGGGFASGALIAMDASPDFQIAGDFTIEYLVKPNGWRSSGLQRQMLGTPRDNVGGVLGDWVFVMDTAGRLTFTLSCPGAVFVRTTSSGDWGGDGVTTAIAAVRAGDTLMLFVNGAMVSSATGVISVPLANREIGIGAAADWAASFLNNQGSGVYDEIRITAAARYTSDGYTPSAQAFSDG